MIYINSYAQQKFDILLRLLRTRFLDVTIDCINQKDFIVSFVCLGKSYRYRCSAGSAGDDIFVRYLPEFESNGRLFTIICREVLKHKFHCAFCRIHSENVLWIKTGYIGIDCCAPEKGIPILEQPVKVLHNSFLISCRLPQPENVIYFEKAILEFNFEGLALSIADDDKNVKVVMPEENDIFPKEIYRHYSTLLFEVLLERLVSHNYKFGHIIFLCFEGINTEMYMKVLKKHFPDSEICCQNLSIAKAILPDLQSTVAFFRDQQLFVNKYGTQKFMYSISGFLDDYFGEWHAIAGCSEGVLEELASDKIEWNVFRFYHSFINSASIGSGSMNDICIVEESVSLQHAKISLIDAYCAEIKDFNSSYGTYVNGELVIGKRLVRSGDIIRIGKSNDFIFQIRENKIVKTHIPCIRTLFYRPQFASK